MTLETGGRAATAGGVTDLGGKTDARLDEAVLARERRRCGTVQRKLKRRKEEDEGGR